MVRTVIAWEGQRGHGAQRPFTVPPDCALLGSMLPTADVKEGCEGGSQCSWSLFLLRGCGLGLHQGPSGHNFPLSRFLVAHSGGRCSLLGSVGVLSEQDARRRPCCSLLPAISLSSCPVLQRPSQKVSLSRDNQVSEVTMGPGVTGHGGEGKGIKLPVISPLRASVWVHRVIPHICCLGPALDGTLPCS